MHDIDGVVDVQRHLARRAGMAGAIDVDHGVAHGRHLVPVRRVLPARDGRLRAQICAAVRQASAGQLESGIAAQMVEIVAVLIAAGDGQDAGAQDVGHAVRHKVRIARVGDQGRELVGDPQTPLGGGEQHHAAIGRDASAIERGGDFLARDGWEMERQQAIFGHGGCGSRGRVDRMASTPNSVNAINRLRDTRQRIPAMPRIRWARDKYMTYCRTKALARQVRGYTPMVCIIRGFSAASFGVAGPPPNAVSVPLLPDPQVTVVAVRPEMGTDSGLDQLAGHAHPVARFAHRAFEDVANAEFAALTCLISTARPL